MKTYGYDCLHIKQRPDKGAPEFLLFAAKAEEIFEWAALERYTTTSKKGPQRIEKPAKTAEVKRFLERNERNTIPTALLVSLHVAPSVLKPLAEGKPGFVSVSFECDETPQATNKAGIIIDGQHRLLGVKAYNPDTLLNVVALLNPSDDETAFQFLIVNNKASRVSNNHLRALALNYREAELSKRLREVRMTISQHLDFVGFVDTEAQSPFRGLIDWPNNPTETRFVAPNAIESSIAYLKQKRIPELEDDSLLLGFFLTIWSKIAAKWPKQFTKGTHLLEKVPIICLTQYLADSIIHEYDDDQLDIANFEKVAEHVDKVLDTIAPKLWEVTWITKSLDTSNGRATLLESITQVRRNNNADRNWYDNVAVVDLESDLL